MNELILAAIIVAGFTIAAAFADAPKSKTELAEMLHEWHIRLMDEDDFYFEAMRDIRTAKTWAWATSGEHVSDFAAWHEMQDHSWLRDRLSFARFEHRRGRHLMRVRLFHLIDRFAPAA